MRLTVRVSGEPHQVDFPAHQPSAVTLTGRYFADGGERVLKILKVADLRAALHGRIREPARLALLRRLPLADRPFAPTRSRHQRIAAFHDQTRPWLRDLDPVRCRALLARAVPELPTTRRDELIDTHLKIPGLLQLAPDVSRVTTVDLPELGPSGVPALCQSAITGWAYRLPLGTRCHTDQDFTFLLLLATARRLAEVHAVGLNLRFRYDGRGHCLVFPTVRTAPHGPGLAIVDFVRWATPVGGVTERAAFRLGYGSGGIVRRLTRTLLDRTGTSP